MTVTEETTTTTTKDESNIFQNKITDFNPMLVKGKGIYMTLEDAITKEQKLVIDGTTGAAVGSLGFGYQKVIDQLKDVMEDCFYSMTTRVSNYHAEALSDYLCQEVCPKGVFESAIFTCSGSEANEMNMKIAHQYHHEKGDYNRTVFISRQQAYHGFTLGCMEISGSRSDEWKELLTPHPKVSNIYPYRNMLDGETETQYKDRLLKELDDKFQEIGPDKVIAFITEPLSSSCVGSCPPVPGYLDGVRKICDKYGALLFFDEVMCGSGRTGTFCAWEQFMESKQGPDLQSIGKAMGNGYVPVSACLISSKVKSVFKQGSNLINGGQTYHCHPFICAATLLVQKELKKEGFIANIAKTGNYLGQQLKEKLLTDSVKTVGDVRGRGGFWSLEFVQDKASKKMFDKSVKIHDFITDSTINNGIQCMVIPQGFGVGDHLILAPAFILTMEDADKIVEIMVKVVKDVDEYAMTL